MAPGDGVTTRIEAALASYLARWNRRLAPPGARIDILPEPGVPGVIVFRASYRQEESKQPETSGGLVDARDEAAEAVIGTSEVLAQIFAAWGQELPAPAWMAQVVAFVRGGPLPLAPILAQDDIDALPAPWQGRVHLPARVEVEGQHGVRFCQLYGHRLVRVTVAPRPDVWPIVRVEDL